MKSETIHWLSKTPLGWPLVVVGFVSFAAISMFIESRGYVKISEDKELFELINGNTLRGDSIYFYYAPGGNLIGKVSDYDDQGSWFVDTGTYCERWNLWGEGETLCWTIQRKGNRIIRESVNPLTHGDFPVINQLKWIKGKD